MNCTDLCRGSRLYWNGMTLSGLTIFLSLFCHSIQFLMKGKRFFYVNHHRLWLKLFSNILVLFRQPIVLTWVNKNERKKRERNNLSHIIESHSRYRRKRCEQKIWDRSWILFVTSQTKVLVLKIEFLINNERQQQKPCSTFTHLSLHLFRADFFYYSEYAHQLLSDSEVNQRFRFISFLGNSWSVTIAHKICFWICTWKTKEWEAYRLEHTSFFPLLFAYKKSVCT